MDKIKPHLYRVFEQTPVLFIPKNMIPVLFKLPHPYDEHMDNIAAELEIRGFRYIWISKTTARGFSLFVKGPVNKQWEYVLNLSMGLLVRLFKETQPEFADLDDSVALRQFFVLHKSTGE